MRVQINCKIVFHALWLAGALFVLSGCGKKVTEVTGTVKMKGQPITLGEISFIGEDGSLDTSQIQNGAYAMHRAPVGKVKITVKSIQPVPYVNRRGGMKNAPDSGEALKTPESESNAKNVEVPKKYNDQETTDLTYEVKSGKQEYNIDLTP
jgi:hypothetical protein